MRSSTPSTVSTIPRPWRSSRIAPCDGLTPMPWPRRWSSPAPGTSGRTSATTRSSTASWSRDRSSRSPRPDGSTRAASRARAAGLALDRRVWTRWTAPQRPGQWFELDLGRPYPVAQLTLAAAPWPGEAPLGLRVETSVDGSTWRTAASVADGAARASLVEGPSPGRRQREGHRPHGATSPLATCAWSRPRRKNPARCGALPSCSSTRRPRRRGNLRRRPPRPRPPPSAI